MFGKSRFGGKMRDFGNAAESKNDALGTETFGNSLFAVDINQAAYQLALAGKSVEEVLGLLLILNPAIQQPNAVSEKVSQVIGGNLSQENKTIFTGRSMVQLRNNVARKTVDLKHIMKELLQARENNVLERNNRISLYDQWLDEHAEHAPFKLVSAFYHAVGKKTKHEIKGEKREELHKKQLSEFDDRKASIDETVDSIVDEMLDLVDNAMDRNSVSVLEYIQSGSDLSALFSQPIPVANLPPEVKEDTDPEEERGLERTMERSHDDEPDRSISDDAQLEEAKRVADEAMSRLTQIYQNYFNQQIERHVDTHLILERIRARRDREHERGNDFGMER